MPRSERGSSDRLRTDVPDESWDPLDDVRSRHERTGGQWDWHGRSSWGQRLVAAFPLGALVAAGVLFIGSTVAASGPPAPAVELSGTGGAVLASDWSAPAVGADPAAPGTSADYREVTFARPSGPERTIEGSTSLSLPLRGLAGQRQCHAGQRDDPGLGWPAPCRGAPGDPGLPWVVPHHDRCGARLLRLPVRRGLAPGRAAHLGRGRRRAGHGRPDRHHGDHG